MTNRSRPYYIVTGEWVQQSKGFQVPFYLCDKLNALGYEAYVTARKPAPDLNTPLLTPEILAGHRAQNRETIGVYTEAMRGNALKTDVVVRWMLNRSGRVVDAVLGAGELDYYWNEAYSTKQNPRILCLPCINRNVFNDAGVDDAQRQGFAYYVHKFIRDGGGEIDAKLRENGISLCQDIPRTHEEIADILRKVKVLYCYEDSAIIVEASLCGCTTVLINTDFMTGLEACFEMIDYVISPENIDISQSFEYIGKSKAIWNNSYNKANALVERFIDHTQNARIAHPGNDKLEGYCNSHDEIHIYGAGLIGAVVYNVLRTIGIYVSGFVVTEKKVNTYMGLPVLSIDEFARERNGDTGLILAMAHGNAKQVIPELKKRDIRYFA
jgi:hypothetical protein